MRDTIESKEKQELQEQLKNLIKQHKILCEKIKKAKAKDAGK